SRAACRRIWNTGSNNANRTRMMAMLTTSSTIVKPDRNVSRQEQPVDGLSLLASMRVSSDGVGDEMKFRVPGAKTWRRGEATRLVNNLLPGEKSSASDSSWSRFRVDSAVAQLE